MPPTERSHNKRLQKFLLRREAQQKEPDRYLDKANPQHPNDRMRPEPLAQHLVIIVGCDGGVVLAQAVVTFADETCEDAEGAHL